MPKLTKEQITKSQYVSMADFCNKVDQIENFDEKVKFATNYLLSHGANGAETDYSFQEAVHIARMKLIDASAKLRDKIFNDENGPDPADLFIDEDEYAVNPYAEEEKDDIENEFFIGHPAEYLKAKAEKYAKELNEREMLVNEELFFRDNCTRLASELTPAVTHEILQKEAKKMPVFDITARMEAKYGGKEGLKEAEKLIAPSFVTKLFGTRSTAGKNFDEVYAAFHNPNHVLYGNLDALEIATQQYVDYKDATKGTAERLAGLAVKEPKEGFALRLLDAIKEQKANNEIFETVVGGCANKKLTAEKVEAIKGPEPVEQQEKVPLVLDLDGEDEEYEEEESMESEEELENENEVNNDPEI